MMPGHSISPSNPAQTLSSSDDMCTILRGWTAAGWLRPLDRAFAEFLWREAPDASPWLILAATLASHQLGRGHVCLDLEATYKNPQLALSLPPEDPQVTEPPKLPEQLLKQITLDDWQSALKHDKLISSGAGNTPLVWEANRLYLRRYWAYEQAIRAQIGERLTQSTAQRATIPTESIKKVLDTLFQTTDAVTKPDWQKIACATAASSSFSIITGGPGTGKTTTVVRLLALLQTLALTSRPAGKALRIGLAAPTGKAAARLNQSIGNAIEKLTLPATEQAEAIRAAIPKSVTTLHRLLGSLPDSRRFRHNARNPLALDVLVIDEASMIDLEMMATVLAALPSQARLILLGDKDQLASVEAGAVLGELCRRADEGHFTSENADWLRRATGEDIPSNLMDSQGHALDQSMVMLRHSYRFGEASGIGQLARAVNAGDAAKVASVLKKPYADIQYSSVTPSDEKALKVLVTNGGDTTTNVGDTAQTTKPLKVGYGHYLSCLKNFRPEPEADQAALDAWASNVLEAYSQFQLLCALRRGPWGVEALNQRIEGWLAEKKLIVRSAVWYEGRPVIITRNDYSLGLMNGDIGITLDCPRPNSDEKVLRVAFRSRKGVGIHWVTPSRLDNAETVFALTVHKSQGSEFTHAALVLPDKSSPILTRELLYTGITRASDWFTLVNAGDSKTLDRAVKSQVQRSSGLNKEPFI